MPPAPVRPLPDTSAAMLGLATSAETISAAFQAAASAVARSAASAAQAAAAADASRSAVTAAAWTPAAQPAQQQLPALPAESATVAAQGGMQVHSSHGLGRDASADSTLGHVLHELLTAALWCA